MKDTHRRVIKTGFAIAGLILAFSGRVGAVAFIDLGVGLNSARAADETVRGEVKDFETYASSALNNDGNLTELSYTEEEVIMAYRDRGHFLALVPIDYTTKVKARPSGEVEFLYPWYSELSITNRSEKEIRIRRAVEAALSRKLVGSVRAEGKPENLKWTESDALLVAQALYSSIDLDKTER